jgi:hypothetical protein
MEENLSDIQEKVLERIKLINESLRIFNDLSDRTGKISISSFCRYKAEINCYAENELSSLRIRLCKLRGE